MSMGDVHYYKLRYTLAEGEQVQQAVYKFIGLLSAQCISLGYERYDKAGEATNPHVHFHFCSEDIVGTIRKRLQRQFKTAGEVRTGNILYSLKEEEDVKEPKRFYRYPLKQLTMFPHDFEGFLREKSIYPEGFDYRDEKMLASEEYAHMVAFCRKKQDEVRAPSTKDKLFEWLDAVHQQRAFTMEVDILENILKYYNQEEKSANQATIMGYLNTAVLRYKLMTEREMALKWLR